MSTTLRHTAEQLAIISAAANTNDSLLIEARAGSGKTSTLIEILPVLTGATVLMAFNKAIAKELDTRTQHLPFATRVALEIGTVHALGLKAYTRGNGRKPRVNGGKVSFILKDWLGAKPQRERDYWKPATYLISRMVSGAKNNGFDVPCSAEQFPTADDEGAWYTLMEHMNWDVELEDAGIDLEKAVALAMELLNLSNRQTEIIDFDDMIYLPLLRNYSLPAYANVLIDEAQDISATRRELAFRMLRPGGRIIAVGDEFQAIYGFTGADASSLPNIAKRSGAVRLPLTTCWRCDANIIEAAQKIVPDIVCKPGAATGSVDSISYSFVDAALTGNLPAEKLSMGEHLLPREGDAILCRLNKPNVAMCLSLLRGGRRARIEGRDIGKRLAAHVKTAGGQGYVFKSLPELIVDVEQWCESEARMLASKGRESSAAMLEDEVGAAVLLMERCLEQGKTDYADLEWMIADLFDDDIPAAGVITLSSVHKSKGREWPRVYILGRSDYMPFHRATQPWEKQQERNLIYVAITRAEHELVYITDVQSVLDKRKER